MKKIVSTYLIGAVTLLLAGCTDNIELPGQGDTDVLPSKAALILSFNSGSYDGNIEGYDSNYVPDNVHDLTYIGNEEENAINPLNFRVMIFGEDGAFWAAWINHELTNISKEGETVWSVKIPLTEIDPSVIEKMRNNKFKIAVFANWSEYPHFDSNRGNFYENIDKNSIFYMTHCTYDPSYESYSDEVIGKDDNSLGVYGFITGSEPMMGISQDWVKSTYPDVESVESAIRRNYNVPEDYFPSESGFNYSKSWIVWNFGGSKNMQNSGFFNSSNQNSRSQWAEINDNDWYKTIFCNENGEEYNLTLNDDNGSYVSDTKVISGSGTVAHRGLELVVSNDTGAPEGASMNDNYGVNLRVFKTNGNNVKSNTGAFRMDQNIAGSYFHFMAPANGTIRVKCQTIGANSAGINLIARNGELNTTANVITVAKELTPGEINTIDFSYEDKTVRIEKEPEHFCLYSTGSIRIYEIEYIKAYNIFECDREGISPLKTPEGGISMYGVQDYDALGYNVWPEGTTFNLSDATYNTGEDAKKYKYRDVHMLRSVAKCEVFIKKSAFPRPSHLYMRSMNRQSRSNPMDVFTPTDILWNGWKEGDPRTGYFSSIVSSTSPNIDYKTALGIDKEYSYLHQYGCNYKTYEDNSDPNIEETKATEYKNTVAWLFGAWNDQFGWNWGNNNIEMAINDTHYPRIFNTRIYRNDYTHFIYGGENSEYYYYYLYTPERNITDPNNAGKLDERPKLLHMELRFAGRNGDVNMDDNSNFRIYFAENGRLGTFDNRTQYDTMETECTEEQFRELYPIMRNHVYRFYVKGIDMNGLDVQLQVAKPKSRQIDYNFE